MVYDKNSKPRGYAFVEYEHKSDMSGKFQYGYKIICFTISLTLFFKKTGNCGDGSGKVAKRYFMEQKNTRKTKRVYDRIFFFCINQDHIAPIFAEPDELPSKCWHLLWHIS